MKTFKVALAGNPNAGKSSIFNQLTGLRQKTANFPGVTVEKKTGHSELQGYHINFTDLPGTYSFFPNSKDEKLVTGILCNPHNESFPDLIVYVADVNQLERHLLLATQMIDLRIPVVVVLNMIDVFEGNGNTLYDDQLAAYLGVPVLLTDARSGRGIAELKQKIVSFCRNGSHGFLRNEPIYAFSPLEQRVAGQVDALLGNHNIYQSKLIAHHHKWMDFIKMADIIEIKAFIGEAGFEDIRLQIAETMSRFAGIQSVMPRVVVEAASKEQQFTVKLDAIVTNKYFGPVIFFALMFLIFQSIFTLAEYPMTWIEDMFSGLGHYGRLWLPQGWGTDLLIDGLLAGLSGVLVFAPQILILFFFLALLEESGYMSRVVYMFDHIMQKVGLNGRSMVALISSGACAIPAIMSTRTIGNWKERLITIMVAPLIPCSARIPVYTVLIALMVPAGSYFGPFNKQGLVFMALYLLGIVSSLLVALVLKYFIHTDERSYLMLELPQYKKPIWSNVGLEVWDKLIAFVSNAGKIIIMISIVLWFLASFGPSNAIDQAAERATVSAEQAGLDQTQSQAMVQSAKLEASFAGRLGKFMEPGISPLGFDWKIGIALVTSFAAREVFVGTMATIYSIGGDAEESSVRQRMAAEMRPGTNKPMYDTATSLSLLIFYAFAMQCMSTLAITRKETNSWKWPMLQFILMTGLAYLGSWIVYTIFS